MAASHACSGTIRSAVLSRLPSSQPACPVPSRRTGGSAPACAHACRRALFTAAATLRCPVPGAGDLLQRPPRRRHRRDLPEQLPLIAHHPEIADHPGAVGDRARQVAHDPAPVMPPQRRRQRLRQARRQAPLIRKVPQQRQPGMRRDARTAASDFQTPRPPCSVHVESAPRTRRDEDLNTPYRPSSGALFRSGAAQPPDPYEKTGLRQTQTPATYCHQTGSRWTGATMRSIQWGKIYGIGDSRQGSLLISYV